MAETFTRREGVKHQMDLLLITNILQKSGYTVIPRGNPQDPEHQGLLVRTPGYTVHRMNCERSLLISNYPNCCAIAILHGFPQRHFWPMRGDGEAGTKEKATHIKHFTRLLKNAVDAIGKERATIIQLVLSQFQEAPPFKELLDELGFEPVLNDHFNPKSGNNMTIYQRVVNVEEDEDNN